tara:strand:+ start:213 stop:662 length:450 start_codon:yes stop_codon:yes gene_type:complete
MESLVSPMFETILSAIRTFEEKNTKDLETFYTNIREKDEQIKILTELKDAKEQEMNDFLKVSFAHRWKKNCEEQASQIIHLENKIRQLITVNEQLNYKLDKLSEKKDAQTQTKDYVIKIETKKGAKYVLNNNILYSNEGKEAGRVIEEN